MAKLNVLALAERPVRRETRTFGEGAEAITLTLRAVDFNVAATAEAVEAREAARWLGKEGTGILPVPGQQTPIRLTRAQVRLLSYAVAMQDPDDAADLYDFFELAVYAYRRYGEWNEVATWMNALMAEGVTETASGNASAACEDASSAPPSATDGDTPAWISTLSPSSNGSASSSEEEETVPIEQLARAFTDAGFGETKVSRV